MTDPPAKATCSARARPVRAAWVVRVLARMATRMPRKPASPDARAPVTKDRAMRALDSTLPMFATASSAATITTNIASTRYSALRKAMAPSEMLAPMAFIFSVPPSWRLIQAVRQMA